MSDTDEDAFDREAEKERLRQQLAEEEAEREATQRMSELLLKGATMTNRHCEECGDPIFRHEGREFCPTCGRQRAADGTPASDAPDETVSPVESEGTGVTGKAADGPERPASPAGRPAASEQPGPSESTAARSDRSQTGIDPQPGSAPTGEADLPAAREALARKVTALAREAEATGDVGRARELLAAVREGAEALRALEDAGQ